MRITFLLFLACFFVSAYAQTDTIPPQLICKSQVTTAITATGLVSIWDTSFIQSVTDNVTPPAAIELGIRQSCTGYGFPKNQHFVTYTCNFGPHPVEVWARDAAGNTATCPSKAFIQDVFGNCDPFFSLSAVWANDPNLYIDQVDFQAYGYNCIGDTFQNSLFSPQGPYYIIGFVIPDAGYNTAITPVKTANPLNGVTTADLVRISKHLLGIAPFYDPWQYLAADVNHDDQVTTYDIVLIRKLLLGLLTEFPGGNSWRFVPEGFVFADPDNPLVPSPPVRIEVQNTDEFPQQSFFFRGVKLGDVDFSADPGQ